MGFVSSSSVQYAYKLIIDHFEEDEPSGSSTQGGRTINEDGNEQHEPYNEVQEDNRDDEEDTSDQGTDGHVTKPPSMHQPFDQRNGNNCCTALTNPEISACLMKQKLYILEKQGVSCLLGTVNLNGSTFARRGFKFFVTTVSRHQA